MNDPIKRLYPEALSIVVNALMVLGLFLAIYFGWANFKLLELYFNFEWVKTFAIAVPFALSLMILATIMYRYKGRFGTIFLVIALICVFIIYFLTERVIFQLDNNGMPSSIFFFLYFQFLILLIIGIISMSYLRKIMIRLLRNTEPR